MSELTIRLTGVIEKTNFDQWKTALIEQIRSVKKDLAEDEDFVVAAGQVKAFKDAETELKTAKQSALQQAEDIQRLFSAIDEVTEEARQARLSLERQIKRRKAEIKEAFIQAGLDEIKAHLGAQDADFQTVDHRPFLDRARLEAALSGKRTSDRARSAIGKVRDDIIDEIDRKAAAVRSNAAKLDALPAEQQPLFQDRATLLGHAPDELDDVIGERVAVFRAQTAETGPPAGEVEPAGGKAEPPGDPTLFDLGADATSDDDDTGSRATGYTITLDLHAPQGVAAQIEAAIRSTYGQHPAVTRIECRRSNRPRGD